MPVIFRKASLILCTAYSDVADTGQRRREVVPHRNELRIMRDHIKLQISVVEFGYRTYICVLFYFRDLTKYRQSANIRFRIAIIERRRKKVDSDTPIRTPANRLGMYCFRSVPLRCCTGPCLIETGRSKWNSLAEVIIHEQGCMVTQPCPRISGLRS